MDRTLLAFNTPKRLPGELPSLEEVEQMKIEEAVRVGGIRRSCGSNLFSQHKIEGRREIMKFCENIIASRTANSKPEVQENTIETSAVSSPDCMIKSQSHRTEQITQK
jgi:hypothetical protein